jgi:aconitase A
MLQFWSGTDSTGKEIYLHDIWPSREEVHQMEEEHVILSMFKTLKEKVEVRVLWGFVFSLFFNLKQGLT